MEKREAVLYTITIFSFIAIIYIVFGAVSKIPNIADERFTSLTGNIILDLEDNLKVGESLNGNIAISWKETNDTVYGMILLTKDNNPIITETFNLKEVLNKDENSEKKFIRVEEIIEYQFEEKGNYEILFSVLDLDINIKKEILVE